MFNSAALYQAKFSNVLEEDFKKHFPGVCDEIKMQCFNCPKGSQWADCVYIYGRGYWTAFSVYLSKMYGNCGVAIVSSLDIKYELYHKGICTWWLGWITKMLTEMGYTIAIGTTNPNQCPIEPKLVKAGWEQIESCNFTNRRTNNAIKFWRLNLPPKEVPPPAAIEPPPPIIEPAPFVQVDVVA